MNTLRIKAWRPEKAWAVGSAGFTHLIVSKRLESVAQVRGVALRRLTRRVLRHELLEVPLRDNVDPDSFIAYLAAYGAEVTLSPDVHHPPPNQAMQGTTPRSDA